MACKPKFISLQSSAERDWLWFQASIGAALRPRGLLLPFAGHARFGAGEIAARGLDVGHGLGFLEHLQRRPIGGNRFRQPLLVALAHAELTQGIAEVVLGPGP